jgi:hypothetical protein
LEDRVVVEEVVVEVLVEVLLDESVVDVDLTTGAVLVVEVFTTVDGEVEGTTLEEREVVTAAALRVALALEVTDLTEVPGVCLPPWSCQ